MLDLEEGSEEAIPAFTFATEDIQTKPQSELSLSNSMENYSS
jgi:hypothetical protein